jgi:cytochrome c biogenesis protein CcmG/thiol:disulfide interchange protein DsbE
VRHPTRWIALTVAVVVAAFAIVLATQVSSDPSAEAQRSPLLGKAVPAFDVRTLAGDPVTRESVAGKAVIVNFWNSWCPPCVDELPAVKEFYDRHAGEPDFTMIGIVRDDTRDAIRKAVKRHDIGWTVAMDPDAQAALDFGTRGQPETFAVSPDGTIVGAQIGPSDVRGLEKMLAAARGETT